MGGVRGSGAEPVPVDPVLTWDQLLQRNESLTQQSVLPESSVPQNPQVDHPLVQVAARDPLVHQLRGRGNDQPTNDTRPVTTTLGFETVQSVFSLIVCVSVTVLVSVCVSVTVCLCCSVLV